MDNHSQEQALYVKWQHITSRLNQIEKLLVDLAIFHRSAEWGMQRFSILNRVHESRQTDLTRNVFSRDSIVEEEMTNRKLHSTWGQLVNRLTDSERLLLRLAIFHGDVRQAIDRYVTTASLPLEQQERLNLLFTRDVS